MKDYIAMAVAWNRPTLRWLDVYLTRSPPTNGHRLIRTMDRRKKNHENTSASGSADTPIKASVQHAKHPLVILLSIIVVSCSASSLRMSRNAPAGR